MNRQELIEGLRIAETVLQINKKIVTPKLLSNIESVLLKYRDNVTVKQVFSVLLNVNEEELEALVNNFLKLVDAERKLVETNLTNELVGTIKEIQNRPLVLRMLAGLI